MKISLRNCLALLVFVLTSVLASAAEYAIIVHPSGPDSLGKDDVRNILLGNKSKWDAGGVIKLAVLTSGSAHEAVVQEFTARSSDQFDKYWKKQVFTGKGIAPDCFKTDADMIAFVARTPGAFGYVSAGAAPAGVKVITIQ